MPIQVGRRGSALDKRDAQRQMPWGPDHRLPHSPAFAADTLIAHLHALLCHAWSCPRPALRARTMASTRSATWSLLKMLVMWLRTVRGLSTRRSASPALLTPCAM